MVDFEDIVVKDEVLTATAINLDTSNKESIIARIDGSFRSGSDCDIVKATWNIIGRYK